MTNTLPSEAGPPSKPFTGLPPPCTASSQLADLRQVATAFHMLPLHSCHGALAHFLQC